MQLNATKLVASLISVGTILSAAAAFAAEPKFSPESYLSRGAFRLAVFNRDETRLITATNELAQLWDLKTGALLQQFEGHTATIRSVCFSPDEKQIVSGAGKYGVHGPDDPALRLWDVSSGDLLAVLSTVEKDLIDEIGKSFSHSMNVVSFSPDGQRILSVLDSRTAIPDAAVLWNMESREIDLVLSRISTSSGSMVIPKPVQFSPDGEWLSGFVNKSSQVVIWNAKTGDVRNRYNAAGYPDPIEHQSRFELLQWSPSGKALLAVLSDRTVRIWDFPTGTESQRIVGHDDRIRDAYFFADESQVITASGDRTVRLWDVQSGKQLQQWDYTDPIQAMSVSPDRKRLLTRTIRSGTSNVDYRWFGEIRDVKSGKSIRKWEIPPMGIAENLPFYTYQSPIMSPSGRLVLTTVWADGEVEVALVDAETGVVRRTY